VKQYASTPASWNSISKAVGDPPGLADQLVGALVDDDPAATGLDVGPLGAVSDLAIEEDPERDGAAPGRRAHDEVDIVGVELEGDPSAGLVQDRGVLGDRPASREVPIVEGEPCSCDVDVGLVEDRGVL